MEQNNQDRQKGTDSLALPAATKLWGVDEHLRALSDLLTDPDGPRIIAIEGVGGIGKSALVAALVRHLMETRVLHTNATGSNSNGSNSNDSNSNGVNANATTVSDTDVIGSEMYAGLAWLRGNIHIRPTPSLGNEHQKEMAEQLLASLSGGELVNGLASQLFGDNGRPIGLTPPQLASLVAHHLSAKPRLIVIDNVEALGQWSLGYHPNPPAPTCTWVDNGAYPHGEPLNGSSSNDSPSNGYHAAKSVTLIDAVRRMVNPSRVLLTTRHGLLDEGDVYRYPLDELNGADALHLIRAIARQHNHPNLATASGAELDPIVEAVGGYPLALRLIASQPCLHHPHTLRNLLIDLAAVQDEPIEALYSRIFKYAWQGLDDAAREIWLLMPVVASGGRGMTLAELAEISDIESAELYKHLEELVSCNLIELVGEPPNYRYSIHSLAREFLHKQVLNRL